MAKTKLHKPHGKNGYCGPTALSAMTGLSTDDAAAVVRIACNKTAVRGMYDSQMIAAIRKLGGDARFASVATPCGQSPTLQQWMDARPDYLRSEALIVSAGYHYMVVQGDLLLCSITKGEKVHILSHPFARKRFQSALTVTLPAKVKLPPELKVKRGLAKANASSTASARNAARRLAARLHLEFEQDSLFIIPTVSPSGREFWREILSRGDGPMLPDAPLTDVDDEFYETVLEGDSYGRDWGEALQVCERAAGYVKEVTGVDLTGRRGVIG